MAHDIQSSHMSTTVQYVASQSSFMACSHVLQPQSQLIALHKSVIDQQPVQTPGIALAKILWDISYRNQFEVSAFKQYRFQLAA